MGGAGHRFGLVHNRYILNLIENTGKSLLTEKINSSERAQRVECSEH